MRAKSPSGCRVVRKDQKGAMLRDFVLRNITARRETANSDCAPICLVARSFESPVARVLISMADEIAALGLHVRAVITAIDSGDFGGDIAVGLGAPFTSRNTRVVRDARLYDAHEQLILDGMTTWIGDCMRREPSKTDSYERFAENCPITAKWARRSFTSLWQAAQPTTFVVGASLGVVTIAETIEPVALQNQTVKETVLTSATRH